MLMHMASEATSLGRLVADRTFVFVCDMQKKILSNHKSFLQSHTPTFLETTSRATNRTVQTAYILGIPVIATEHDPKDFGGIMIDVSKAKVFAKTKFSMIIPEVEEILICEDERKSVILSGLETHTGIQQTALDLRQRGFDVHILADGVTSRSLADRKIAIERLKLAGCFITTSESAIVELVGDSKHPKFKDIQALIKTPIGFTGLENLM